MALLHRWTLDNTLKDSAGKLNLKNWHSANFDTGKTTRYAGKTTKGTTDNTEKNFYASVDFTTVTTSLSVSLWAYIDNTDTTNIYSSPFLIGGWNAWSWTDVNFGIVYKHSENKLIFNIGNGSQYTCTELSTTLKRRCWYHIAAVYNYGKSIALYVNGQKAEEKPTTVIPSLTGYYCVGGNNATQYAFSGLINDVRFYNHALTDNEIKELAQGSVLHYNFNFEELYQPIEYIESTGTQWIDTNYYPKLNKTKVIADAEKAISFSIFGSGQADFTFTGGGQDGEHYEHYAYYNNKAALFTGTTFTDRHLYILDKNKVYIDDANYGERTLATGTCKNTLAIFGRKNNGSANDLGPHKLYGLKIYEDDILIKDFIPVIRKSDLKPGLFDLVNYEFYTNRGSGEFLCPSNINKLLNTEYKFLDYVESVGYLGGFINTGFKPNQNSGIEIQFANTSNSNNHSKICGGGGESYQDRAFEIYTWNEQLQFNYGNSALYLGSMPEPGTIITAWQKKTEAGYSYSNGSQTYTGTHTANSFTAPRELCIGTLNRTASGSWANFTTTNTGSTKFYYCKIWDNDKLIRHYLPAKRVCDDKVGFFDLVNNIFVDVVGTFIEPGIPDEYKEVEYLQSSGTQYINTLITSSEKIGLVVEAAVTANSTGELQNYIFGSQQADANINWYSYCTVKLTTNGVVGCEWSDDGRATSDHNISYQVSTNTKYKISFNFIAGEFWIGNNKLKTGITLCDCKFPLYLFGDNLLGNFARSGSIRIYQAKIYNDMALVRDFVPCIRKSDNKPGMYDRITQAFFTNSGTGEFTFPASNNNDYVSKNIKINFRPIPYIESTRIQYIDTGIEITDKLETQLDFAFSSYDNNERYVFGFDSPTVIGMINGAGRIYEFGEERYSWPLDTNRHTAIVGKNIVFDGSVIDENIEGWATGKNGFLFCANTVNGVNYFSNTKLYSCKIWNDGTLVRDFIPVINTQTNRPGLYDLVNHNFYANQGTGEFNAPELYLPIEYIESCKNYRVKPYIDTGISAADTITRIEAHINKTNNGGSTTDNGILFGLFDAPALFYLDQDINTTTHRMNIDYTNSSALQLTSSIANASGDKVFVYTRSGNTHSFSVNNETPSTGSRATNWSSTKHHYLFAYNNNGTAGCFYNCKLYSFKIWVNNIIARDFVPVLRIYDGKPGLFDKVENKFYTNAGTGEFRYANSFGGGRNSWDNYSGSYSSDSDDWTFSKYEPGGWEWDECSEDFPLAGTGILSTTAYSKCAVSISAGCSRMMVGVAPIGYSFRYEQGYFLYPDRNNRLCLYLRGTNSTQLLPEDHKTWTSGDRLRVSYDGEAIYFYHNDVQVYKLSSGIIKGPDNKMFINITDWNESDPPGGCFNIAFNALPDLSNKKVIYWDASGYENPIYENDADELTECETLSVTTSGDTALGNQSLIFDGMNHLKSSLDSSFITDKLTTNIWVYKNDWSNTVSEQIIACSKDNTTGATHNGWNFAIGSNSASETGTGTYLKFVVDAGAAHARAAKLNVSSLTSGWHMFTGTYDSFMGTGHTTGNSYVKLYIDGNLADTDVISSAPAMPINYVSSHNVTIGARYNRTNDTVADYFNGKIADIKIWATTLSDEDIENLYKVKAAIDENYTLTCNTYIDAIENTFTPTNITFNSLNTNEAIPGIYYDVQRTSNYQYSGISIDNSSNFIINHWYKLSFNIKSATDNKAADYVRGHCMYGFDNDNSEIFIDGHYIGKKWHIGSALIPDQRTEWDAVGASWRHYDVYLKCTKNTDPNGANLYIQPDRSVSGTGRHVIITNITLTDYGLNKPEVLNTHAIDFVNKASVIKGNNILENSSLVGVSKNNTILVNNIHED